jgi:cytochrome c oxidase subunit 1
MTIPKSTRSLILGQLALPLVLLVLGIYHGLMQTLYRAGIIRASSFLGLEYYQGLTAHGVINAVVLTTFFAVAFGNALVCSLLGMPIVTPLAVGSFILMTIGTLMVALTILSGHGSVLYTFYPPLKAHPIFYLGLALFVVGSWLAFYAWIPAYRRWRKINPGEKTPLAVVGIFSTFIVWQIATLPVAYEVLVMLLPWSLGWTADINVTLAKTLFWFFGHPLVYFWLLPTYVMYYTMLPRLAGGKLFSDFGGRLSFLAFCVLSSPLGLHHQYSDPGIASQWKALHAVLTSLVAIPSLMTAFTVAASLEHGARERGGTGLFAWWGRLPYFEVDRWLFPYLFCGLVIFIFGGITGVVNASYGMNMVIHNTAWIPAHFHLTVGGPVFLGILGMSLYLVAGLTGKKIAAPKAALAVPYLWMAGLFILSGAMFIGGLEGEPRRTNLGLSYLNPGSAAYRPEWLLTSQIAVIGGIVMTLAIVVYFYTLIKTALGPSSETEANRFEFPIATPYHDENVGAVKNFMPWLIAAVVACIIAYTPPLYQIYQGNYQNAPGYTPDSPVPITK